jgi:hypothetical protein
MSVALLAQGDTVPRRGITTTSAPPAAPAPAPTASRAPACRAPRGQRLRWRAQCTWRAETLGDARLTFCRPAAGLSAEVGQGVAAFEMHQVQGMGKHAVAVAVGRRGERAEGAGARPPRRGAFARILWGRWDNPGMTITIKTASDIEGMRLAGRLASEVLDMLTPHVQARRHHRELDRLAHDHM